MSNSVTNQLIVRQLGQQDYQPIWQRMSQFTDQRQHDTIDEIWLLQHPPVFTQGQAGKAHHLINTGDIPVIQVDRGGQVTYHGPGQLIVYLLIDLNRRNLSTRQFVELIEQIIIDFLTTHGITAYGKRNAPGVYINNAKIAALGLRIRRGCSFHGLSFNIDMDLEPFKRINPCGFPGQAMTQLKDHLSKINWLTIENDIIDLLANKLAYTDIINVNKLSESTHGKTN